MSKFDLNLFIDEVIEKKMHNKLILSVINSIVLVICKITFLF